MNGGFLFVIIALFALLWLFVIRPQKRRQVQQRQMLENVAPGDEILTAGGLYGTVRSAEGDEIMLEVAPGTTVRLAKRAVAAVLTPEAEPEPPDEEPEEPDEFAAAGDSVEQKRS